MEANTCQKCGTSISPYARTIHLQGKPEAQILCSECFCKEMAMLTGILLEEFTPQTVEIHGRGRKKHQFYIDRMVYPMGVSLEATEIKEGKARGFKTSVHGVLGCELTELYERLLKKAKKIVSRKYIERKKTAWGKRSKIKNREVAGRIEWDEHEGRLPLLIIDGEEYTWEELGEMIMTYGGWDFRLKIFESWEEID